MLTCPHCHKVDKARVTDNLSAWYSECPKCKTRIYRMKLLSNLLFSEKGRPHPLSYTDTILIELKGIWVQCICDRCGPYLTWFAQIKEDSCGLETQKELD